MTTSERFPTWREAFDYAQSEMRTPAYRGWGWAVVIKDDGHACEYCQPWHQHRGDWRAEIA